MDADGIASPLSFAFDLQRFAGERTEAATPKRRGDARKKGQVPRSHDLGTAAVLLGVFMLLHDQGPHIYELLANYLSESLGNLGGADLTTGQVVAWYWQLAQFMLMVVMPIFAVALAVGVLANFLQVGVLFTAEPLKPKFDKLNPLSGLKRLFSTRALVEMVKSILKVAIVAWVAYGAVRPAYDLVIGLNAVDVRQVFPTIAELVYRVGIRVGMALLVLAILDYAYQRWDNDRSLKMSKQEVKDEYRETEGDPKIKAQIKQKQRQVAMRRMMQKVPEADVIVTNPTHIAVALKYDGRTMNAPEVLAMGADYVAQRIKEIAGAAGIPIVENVPLARALWATADIGAAVPVDLYQAAAQVLAFVYRLKQRRA